MKNLLIVDDIPQYCDTIEPYLEDDFTVFQAKDLNSAKAIISNNQIEIALVDIVLDEKNPDNKDGLLLLEWIKKHYPDTKVIIMSAYKEFDFAVEALKLGAEYFIKKPINPIELVKIIKEIT